MGSNVKINLDELGEAFQRSDVVQGYVDLRRGRVVLLGENPEGRIAEDISEEELLDHIFSVEEDWENYVTIPNAKDENERTFMEAFARSLNEEEIREDVLASLQGSGAVARFHRRVKKHGLTPRWENFLREQFRILAREWCEENDIPYDWRENG